VFKYTSNPEDTCCVYITHYTIKTRQVNNNEETLKKRQQAAERMRPYRARKQQQNTSSVMCHTVSDEQLITPPHIKQFIVTAI
jgi:hypothetical protein